MKPTVNNIHLRGTIRKTLEKHSQEDRADGDCFEGSVSHHAIHVFQQLIQVELLRAVNTKTRIIQIYFIYHTG